MSVIIGVDPHKGSHTAVAIDGGEVALGQLKVRATRRQVPRGANGARRESAVPEPGPRRRRAVVAARAIRRPVRRGSGWPRCHTASLTLAKSWSKVAHEPSDSSPAFAQFVVPMNRSAWQFDLLPELGELASQLAHPMHDRLPAGSEPVPCEADRVTQLVEGSVVVEGFGRAGLLDCSERSVMASELLQWRT